MGTQLTSDVVRRHTAGKGLLEGARYSAEVPFRGLEVARARTPTTAT